MASPSSYASAISYWAYHHPSIVTFQWNPPSTPASSPAFLLSVILAYLLSISSLSFLLSSRRSPVPLGPLPVTHNLILFSISFLMFFGCLISAIAKIGSWQWLFCFPEGTTATGPVFFWSYVFYLSKYYELLDTLILILKRRPITFLHVFHHAIVLVMCYFWLHYAQSLQIIALLTNTSVHMLMYSYYLLCSMGMKPPWKKLVTNCQIVQFLFSFAVSIVMCYLHFWGDGCSGFAAWCFNAFFNGALLLLFFNFHSKQYGGARSAARGAGRQTQKLSTD